MNNEQDEIRYEDVKALGFTDNFQHDPVFVNQYGYQYNIVEKRLTKRIFIEWDITTRKVYMIRCNKEATILSKITLDNLDEVKTIVNFFEGRNNE